MREMFRSSSFNGNISIRDVSAETNMRQMFYGAAFNEDLCNWDLEPRTSLDQTDMFWG